MTLHLCCRRVLKALLPKEIPRQLEIMRGQEVLSADAHVRSSALSSFFQEVAVLRKEEGLVVKSLLSAYSLGETSKCCLRTLSTSLYLMHMRDKRALLGLCDPHLSVDAYCDSSRSYQYTIQQ